MISNKKVLNKKRLFASSAVPSVHLSRSDATRVPEGPKRQAFFPRLFSKKIGKRIDDRKSKCLLGNLSPQWERFFEIYFVRLIGTPNQHIPNVTSLVLVT